MAIGNPIEEIKERLSIVDVVSARVPLKKAGRTFKGLCPFHNEKTPSFIVTPDRGTYHCFGCGESGDIFTFLMKTENLDFSEALETLAQRAGVSIRPRAVVAKEDEKRERIFQLNAAAAQFYYNLLRSESGKPGYDYLQRRGVTEATMESYQLGWAPDAYDLLIKHLTSRGHDRAELVEAGLAVERESGVRDTFRGRVLFPIRDQKGNILGFGGRTLGDAQPKYLNTPASPVFDKGGCLFGIDVARQAIRESGRAVIVEGYMDVIIPHQFGIKNVVGALGTALTDRQVAILKRLTKTLVLALDPDAAGEKAALKGLEVARQAYGESVPVPQAGGLIRMEQRLDADLRIATLPDGLDPDEVVRRDPAEWHRLIESAKPTVDFYFDVVLGKADLSSARGVSEAAQTLLPIVGEVRDQVQQSFYLARLARALGLAENVLRAELNRSRLRQSGPREPAPRKRAEQAVAKAPARPSAVLDEYYVELAVHSLRLTGRTRAPLAAEDLDSVEARAAVGWLRGKATGSARDLEALAAEAAEELPEPIALWLAERIRGPHGVGLLYEADVERELDRCVREIRRRNLRWRSEELADLMRQAAAEGEARAQDQRELVAAAEALLSQLQPIELGATRSAVWRPLEPERRLAPPVLTAPPDEPDEPDTSELDVLPPDL